MNKFFTLYLLLLAGKSLCAQSLEKHQLTLNFLTPGIVYETKLSDTKSLVFEATIGFAYQDNLWLGTEYGIYPLGFAEFRSYYNLDRRLAKGKRIEGNSGNYIAPLIAVQSATPIIGDLYYNSEAIFAGGVVYGLQRTAPKGFNWRFEVGPAVIFDSDDVFPGLILDFRIGWVILKRR